MSYKRQGVWERWDVTEGEEKTTGSGSGNTQPGRPNNNWLLPMRAHTCTRTQNRLKTLISSSSLGEQYISHRGLIECLCGRMRPRYLKLCCWDTKCLMHAAAAARVIIAVRSLSAVGVDWVLHGVSLLWVWSWVFSHTLEVKQSDCWSISLLVCLYMSPTSRMKYLDLLVQSASRQQFLVVYFRSLRDTHTSEREKRAFLS